MPYRNPITFTDDHSLAHRTALFMMYGVNIKAKIEKNENAHRLSGEYPSGDSRKEENRRI